ncbi:MAG: lactate dehydrogenase [Clostridia bacterium]|nr:lactate dehydrogenase [Clostridia bacterium]
MKFAFFGLWEEERPVLKGLCEKYGFEISYATGEVLTVENAENCEGCDGVSVLGKTFITAPIIEKLHACGVKYLATRSIGYNHIDLAALKKYGIRLCNSQYPPDSVAEFTLMLMLMSIRKYKQAHWLQQVNDYALTYLRGEVLARKTVGVMGGGKIGKRVMQLLSGFGSRILCHSADRDEEVEKLATYVDAETLYRESDIITFHVPLLPSTRHMVNAETLKKMKDGVVIINTARGELFDVQALIQGIESKKIGALAMDVFEGEEGIYHEDRTDDILTNRDMAYLRQFPNVVLTQHMAFYTQLSMECMIENSVEGLIGFTTEGKTRLEIVL